MNLITLIRDVCALLGLPRPSAAYASTDAGVQQLVALANKEGRELANRYGWQALTREATWTTVATESQGALSTIIGPTQSLRYILNDTIWDRTDQESVGGPLSARTWQALKASTVTGPYNEYRIRQGTLYLIPAPEAGHTCAFEYVSRSWVTNAAGDTYRTEFAEDTDLVLLDPELMRAGLEWRWLQRKGFEYGESFASYERMVADAMARDGTKPTISLVDQAPPVGGVIVPEGSWPL